MPATLHLRLPAGAPDPSLIAQVADILRRGGLVAFPTETVYGLAANALDENAVRRLFEAKGRPANNPLIVHLPSAAAVTRVASHWPPLADRLASELWPGPLTLVLPRRPELPAVVTGGGPSVAVRVPAHPVARALLEAADLPLAAPSANRSGRLSPTSAEHVLEDLDGRIDAVLDGGATPGGIESTVLDVTTSPPRLLRPGLVSPGEIEALIGPILRAGEVNVEDQPLPSPGLLDRHYAPRTPLVVAPDDGGAVVRSLLAAGGRPGWLTHSTDEVPDVATERLPGDPAGYAAGMYAALHRLDRLGLDRIVVTAVPDGEGWLAIRDRLRRAAF